MIEPPILLTVEKAADAVPHECFPTVERVIGREGGSLQHGWIFWVWPHVLVEAEFHGVWRDPQGQLHEVTGSERDTNIWFVPDNKRRFEGKQIDNVRLAIRDDQVIHDYIWCAEEYFRVTNRGDRAGKFGRVMIPKSEMTFVDTMHCAARMLQGGLRASDLCACGSGKRYKRCHARTAGAS